MFARRSLLALLLGAVALLAVLVVHNSRPALAQDPPPEQVFPGLPQNVQVVPGDGKLTLTWTAPSYWGHNPAAGYEIDVATLEFYGSDNPPPGHDHSNWWGLADLDHTATSYTFTGTIFQDHHQARHTVKNGTKYHLRIRAFNAPGSDPNDKKPGKWVTVSGTPSDSQVTPQNVPAAIVDRTTLAVTEGSSGTFTVALTGDPGASVTVTLVRTQYFQSDVGQSDHRWNLNAATVSPATLTFTSGSSGNYAAPQTVTVSGVEDDDCISEQLVILLLASGDGGYESVGGSVTGVFVTVADDDQCGGL